MTAPSPRQSARDRLLATAGRLFYERGFLGVGVDEIVAESGVAKMTLYRRKQFADLARKAECAILGSWPTSFCC